MRQQVLLADALLANHTRRCLVAEGRVCCNLGAQHPELTEPAFCEATASARVRLQLVLRDMLKTTRAFRSLWALINVRLEASLPFECLAKGALRKSRALAPMCRAPLCCDPLETSNTSRCFGTDGCVSEKFGLQHPELAERACDEAAACALVLDELILGDVLVATRAHGRLRAFAQVRRHESSSNVRHAELALLARMAILAMR
mmetsp:Transcript_20311/g.53639  ORF Transcript_20311/g.53639 Transcript_20311/m.53639 type:complete len:203 (+) Transcript_20311:531-1139(+)